jgi:hypothetical protein
VRDDEQIQPALHASQIHGTAPLAPAPRRSWRWLGILMGEIVLGAIIGFVIVFFLKYVDGPSEGSVNLNLAKQAATPTPRPDSTFASQYISFQYPGAFDVVAQVKTDANALEQYNITSTESYRRSIGITVRPLTSGGVEDDASYRLRTLKAEQYVMTNIKLSGEPAIMAERYDHQERTIFWPHGKYLLTVALVSSDNGDDIAAMMDVVTKKARWLK